MPIEKPEEIKEYLGNYGPQLYDPCASVPIAWGFKIIKRMGEDLFNKCRIKYDLECVGFGQWFIVTKRLSKQDAIDKYGEYQELPRQKYCPPAIMFGEKKFIERAFVKSIKSTA